MSAVLCDLTAEMRKFMPNACGDWADRIDAGLARIQEITRNMRLQAEARMEDASADAKGFLSEAMEQYADQIEAILTRHRDPA